MITSWEAPSKTIMSRILMSVLVACGLLSIRAVSVVATAGECAAGTVVHNHSGCTAAGHYLATTTITAADCCALCANQSACQAWSFHGSSAAISPCYLASNPKVSTTVSHAYPGFLALNCTHPLHIDI
jgi:hypothetical protein